MKSRRGTINLAWATAIVALLAFGIEWCRKNQAVAEYKAVLQESSATQDGMRKSRELAAVPPPTQLSSQDPAPSREQQKRQIIAALLARPETKAALERTLRELTLKRLLNLELTLFPKFREWGVAPDQWNEFETLYLDSVRPGDEGRISVQLAEFAGLPRGMPDGEFNSKAEQLLGPVAYRKFEEYETRQKDHVQEAIHALSDHLLVSDAPLTPQQAGQLSELLDAHRTSVVTEEGVVLGDSIDREIGGILSPKQVAVWRQLQRFNELSLRNKRAIVWAKQSD